jgi:hypothetical protein
MNFTREKWSDFKTVRLRTVLYNGRKAGSSLVPVSQGASRRNTVQYSKSANDTVIMPRELRTPATANGRHITPRLSRAARLSATASSSQ